MNTSRSSSSQADQPSKYPLSLARDPDGVQRQKLSFGMVRSERTSSEIPKLEGEVSLNSAILDFYPSSSRIAARLDDFRDKDGKQPREQSYGLDPTAIFKNVTTEGDIKKLAPEQNITLFALRLAIIEKTASGIGTLSFIWASTIILGGFASNINPLDFIVIALILVTEGTRIFSRSRELEWQHLASKSTDTSSSTPQSEVSLNVGEACASTKNAGGSITTKVSSILESSEAPVPSLETPLKAFYKSHAASVSQVDLESGSSAGPQQKLHRSSHGLPPIATPPGKQKEAPSELDETETDLDIKLGHSMNCHTCLSALDKVNIWKNTNNIDALDDGKFPTTLLEAKNVKRTWSSDIVPILPGGFSSVISTRGVSAVLYWIQITSAMICLVLSCWRLWRQQYNPPTVLKQDTPVNLYTSLNIFYSLALTEALLFLLERAYWEYKINYKQLVVQASNKAELGAENQEMMKQFFYEVYKKCIDGSVFDGLAMDIVEYSLTLLQSDNAIEQLSGLRVLRKIVDRFDGFSLDALRRIGAAPGVVERLLEMLSWRGAHHEDVRREVAALICRMVRYSRNCFRVAAVPGAMDGIVSLLRPHGHQTTDPLSSEQAIALRLDGLRILVAQARDPANLLKIGETQGLIPVLLSFIAVTDAHEFTKLDGNKLKTFRKVLRLLKMLAGARHSTGAILRPVIARVVYGIASMRDILEFGDCHPHLQCMTIEILKNLTLDDDIRRTVGSTGGVIRILFTLFSRDPHWSNTPLGSDEDRKAEKTVSKRAGDALNLLATASMKNCLRMMDIADGSGRKTFIPALISILGEHRPEKTICAAKILRSLLEYGSYSQKREIAVCVVRVMRVVMGSSSQRMHEAVVCLAPRVLAALDEPSYSMAFQDVDRTELAHKLLRNLDYTAQASNKFPRTRRYSIELIMTLVRRDPGFLEEFRRDGVLDRKLMRALDSICGAEDYVIFSGTEGLTRHSVRMEDLILESLHEFRILTQERERTSSETLEV